MLHFTVEQAFDDLLSCWREHHRRQSAAEDVRRLASSRIALDTARQRMHRLRQGLYPEPGERESIVATHFCESLDSVVYIRWLDRDHQHPGNFRCACGQLVPIDWDRVGLPPT